MCYVYLFTVIQLCTIKLKQTVKQSWCSFSIEDCSSALFEKCFFHHSHFYLEIH